jgi:hypothetical protein
MDDNVNVNAERAVLFGASSRRKRARLPRYYAKACLLLCAKAGVQTRTRSRGPPSSKDVPRFACAIHLRRRSNAKSHTVNEGQSALRLSCAPIGAEATWNSRNEERLSCAPIGADAIWISRNEDPPLAVGAYKWMNSKQPFQYLRPMSCRASTPLFVTPCIYKSSMYYHLVAAGVALSVVSFQHHWGSGAGRVQPRGPLTSRRPAVVERIVSGPEFSTMASRRASRHCRNCCDPYPTGCAASALEPLPASSLKDHDP